MSRKVGGRPPQPRIEREALAIARNRLREGKGLPPKEYTYEHPPAVKPPRTGEEKPFIGTPHVRSTRF